jgi:hypothetical protein
VNTVGSYPENGPAFETQRATEGQKILDPLGSSVAAMCEQPVIAHPDAQAPRYPPENNCKEQSFPGKKEQCRNSPDMKGGHEKGCYPVDLAIASELLCWCVLILHNCTTALPTVSMFDTSSWESNQALRVGNSSVKREMDANRCGIQIRSHLSVVLYD